MKFKLRLFSLLLMMGHAGPIGAQTRVSALFGDGMVLQRNQAVAVWGHDMPGQEIQVRGSWGEESFVETQDDGTWRVKIATPPAGGPFELTIIGSEKIAMGDVWSGEVWLCSGQSNMEMPVRGNSNQPVNGSQAAILAAGAENIRLFKVEKVASLTPRGNLSGNWTAAASGTVGEFSATAYFFARRLSQSLGVPIGLVVSSWGASSGEAWTDRATLELLGNVALPTAITKAQPQKTPTALYNGMIHPLIGFGLRGAIWYQGEGNLDRAAAYEELIGSMVRSWRTEWGQGPFPFYFAQIAPYQYGRRGNAAFLREAQMKTVDSLENSGMAVLLDIGLEHFIHPREKIAVGERLAYWALAKTYGVEGIEYAGPRLSQVSSDESGGLLLTFDHVPTGISSFGRELTGFSLAGEDRVFHPAEAKIQKESGVLLLKSEAVPNPVAARYAFESWVEATLFSTSGLPASSFRTDDWAE